MSKKIIEADVEVVSSTKSKKAKETKPSTNDQQSKQQGAQADNPFAAFGMGGAQGMEGMPDLSAMFGADGMPDLSKLPGLPLRQRLMFKLMRLLSSPKLRFLKSKWSIPLWGVIAILFFALALVVVVAILIFKLGRALLKPYFELFRRKA